MSLPRRAQQKSDLLLYLYYFSQDPLSLSNLRSTATMDTLVAHYSRPAFHQEGYSWEEQQELSEATPPLSLKFALPSMPDVGFLHYSHRHYGDLTLITNNEISQPPFFAQRQMTMQIQVAPSSLHMVLLHWPFDSKVVSLSLQIQELLLEIGLRAKRSKK